MKEIKKVVQKQKESLKKITSKVLKEARKTSQIIVPANKTHPILPSTSHNSPSDPVYVPPLPDKPSHHTAEDQQSTLESGIGPNFVSLQAGGLAFLTGFTLVYIYTKMYPVDGVVDYE